MIHFDL